MGIPLHLAASGRHLVAPSFPKPEVEHYAGHPDHCLDCSALTAWLDYYAATSPASLLGDAVTPVLAPVPAPVEEGAADDAEAGTVPVKRGRGTLRIPGVARGRVEARRHVPIHAYVGPNGSGKSLAMVRDTLDSLSAGRPVLSTVRLQDFAGRSPCDDPGCSSPRHGQPGHLAAHPSFVRLGSFLDLMDAEHCDVLLDEVTGVADARESGGMPVQVRNLLVQLRRRDVVLRWTSPSFTFADVTIRRVTQAVTFSRGMMPVDRDGTLWRDRRLFLWRTFDARDIPLDEQRVDASVRLREDGVRPLVRELFWRPDSDAESAYDTSDSVATLGVANTAGMCLTCGGKRLHPKCSCD